VSNNFIKLLTSLAIKLLCGWK